MKEIKKRWRRSKTKEQHRTWLLLHRRSCTRRHTHLYTQTLLHRDAFWQDTFTCRHLQRIDPLTRTRFDTHTQSFLHTHTLLTQTWHLNTHTHMFSRIDPSIRTDMLLHRHRHRHTHTDTHTHTLPHIDALTRIARSRFLHRENLSNNIFTHRQTLVHTEVFIHRRLYTHKL